MINNEESEQNVIRAVLACLIFYLLYVTFFSPRPLPPQPAGEDPATPAVEQVESSSSQEDLIDDPTSKGQGETSSEAEKTPDEKSQEKEVGAELISAPPVLEEVPVEPWKESFEGAEVQSKVTSQGGGLQHVQLKKYRSAFKTQPIWEHLYSKIKGSKKKWQPYGKKPGLETIVSDKGAFLAAGAQEFDLEHYELVPTTDSNTVVLERSRRDGLKITKTYTYTDDPGIVAAKVVYENAGTQTWSGNVWVGTVDYYHGKTGRYSNAVRPALVAGNKLRKLNKISKVEDGEQKNYNGDVRWIGLQDRYFIAAAIPKDITWGKAVFASTKSDEKQAGAFIVHENLNLNAGAKEEINFEIYFGTKKLSSLEKHDKSLTKSVSFGFFGFFSHILLKVMVFFQGFVHNWGLAIICLTVTIKLLFYPLTKKSFVSSRKMQALGPQMKELKERYKDNPQQMGQAQMKLFREEGVNPLAGCLPMLIQMPVWFALYSVLLSAAPLYQAEFLFVKDLASRDPYGVFPTLVGVAMVAQQRITPMSPNADPLQQKIFRMLPLIFVVVMYAFPAGLSLYILVNTLFSIGQMAMVNRAYPAPVAAPAPEPEPKKKKKKRKKGVTQ